MFGGIARYFSGVGLALGVRSGASRVHGAALAAGAQVSRLAGVLPAARAEIVAAAEACLQESIQAQLVAADITELKDFGA